VELAETVAIKTKSATTENAFPSAWNTRRGVKTRVLAPTYRPTRITAAIASLVAPTHTEPHLVQRVNAFQSVMKTTGIATETPTADATPIS
jgi:hypothetical protein